MSGDMRSGNIFGSSSMNITILGDEKVITDINPSSLLNMPFPYGFDVIVRLVIGVGTVNDNAVNFSHEKILRHQGTLAIGSGTP
jgi:hypothetical protein